ncbi:unnamed protein product [Lepeophtheirus salmonis]|uniref:(salmon louse) hypothetical protein n=1 Tax=Lepeophtheirus salmonis TaxID=72036 RepID=A0A7R8HDN6_LEPSM|nr:unnamed protein product [Lepeophtheirus salmonis]CAF3029427.1 unnamed protein product [Lepeophtheirus salmonis]
MSCIQGFIGFTSFVTLLYSSFNLVCLFFLLYVQHFWTLTDYSNVENFFKIFISQYFYDSKRASDVIFPSPVNYICNSDQLTTTEEDTYHSWTKSDYTIIYLIFFLLLNLLWAISSILAIGETCSSKNKKFTKAWTYILFTSLAFHLIASIIYGLGILYPLSLMDCLDPMEDKNSDNGEASRRDIIYAHGPPDVGHSTSSQNPNDISMNPMGHANVGFVNNHDMDSERNNNDIYSRRSSRVMVSRNIQVEIPQSQSPIFVEENRFFPYEVPSSIATQTSNEISTQTANEIGTPDHQRAFILLLIEDPM